MSTRLLLLLVALLLCFSVPPIVTLSVDSNFTACSKSKDGQDLFQISWADAQVDASGKQYTFELLGKSSAARISDLNEDHTFYSTSKTEIVVGVTKGYQSTELARFCEDVVDGCPINTNNWTRLRKTVQLPNLKLPLGDIVGRYSAWTGDKQPITCLSFVPIGFQNSTWASVFRFVPVAVGIFNLLTTILATYATTSIDRDEITTSYIPMALQLRSPGIGDVIYYTQFIVTLGLSSLSYPKFYPLFLSDVAWSFFLLPSQWITKNVTPSNSSSSDATATSPVGGGGTTISDTNPERTALLDFANTIHIDINGLFITVLVYALLLMAAFFVALAVGRAMSYCYPQSVRTVTDTEYYNVMAASSFLKLPRPSRNTVIGFAVRCITACYIPLTITGLHQLMLPASTGILIVAAVVIIFCSFLLYGFISFIMLRLGDAVALLVHSATFTRFGFLYSSYTEGQAKFFIYTILLRLVTCLMLGLFQRYGTVQLSVILAAEALHLCLMLIKWPYVTRQLNILYAVIGWIRLTNLLLNIGFVPTVPTTEASKHYIAYTQITLHMLVYLIYFLFAFRNLCVILLGTKDEEFENSSMVPVRMTLWPRYRRNPKRGRHRRDYYRTPELDVDESHPLSHGGLAGRDTAEENDEHKNIKNNTRDKSSRLNTNQTMLASSHASDTPTPLQNPQATTSDLAPIQKIQRPPLLQQQENRRESSNYTAAIASSQRNFELSPIGYNSNNYIQQQPGVLPVLSLPQPISNTAWVNLRTTHSPPVPPPHQEVLRMNGSPQQPANRHPAAYNIFDAVQYEKPDLIDNKVHAKHDDDINLN